MKDFPAVLIVPRQSPPWAKISEQYVSSGRYRAELFIPSELPPGFPNDLERRIDLWNTTFRLDFFSCRARLAQIALESWDAVDNAVIPADTDPQSIATLARESPETLVCYVDDDDWFAPNLAIMLREHVNQRATAVRWGAPLFNGKWQFRFVPRVGSRQFVSLYRKARANPKLERVYRRTIAMLPGPHSVVPAGNILYTNNYALTQRFLDHYPTFSPAADHCHATDLFLSNNLPLQSLPTLLLSLTNKHPCSAGVLSYAATGEDPKRTLRQYVKQYVTSGTRVTMPRKLGWARRLIGQTVELFSEAL